MTTPLDSPGSLGDTLLDERTLETSDDGDHEKFAHYVQKEKIVESAVTGKPVIALCGKVWCLEETLVNFQFVPTARKYLILSSE